MEEKYKKVDAILLSPSTKKRRFVLVVLSILILAVAGYYFFSANGVQAKQEQSAISQKLSSFYRDYFKAINTNSGWEALIQNYTENGATESLKKEQIATGLNISIGKKEAIYLLNPIVIQITELNRFSKTAKASVLANYDEHIAGEVTQTKQSTINLNLKKINGQWIIESGLYSL